MVDIWVSFSKVKYSDYCAISYFVTFSISTFLHLIIYPSSLACISLSLTILTVKDGEYFVFECFLSLLKTNVFSLLNEKNLCLIFCKNKIICIVLLKSSTRPCDCGDTNYQKVFLLFLTKYSISNWLSNSFLMWHWIIFSLFMIKIIIKILLKLLLLIYLLLNHLK